MLLPSIGVAWLSAVRVVRCSVRSWNERNAYRLFITMLKQPFRNGMKVGMMSSRHDLYILGYTRATVISTARSKDVNLSKSIKTYHGSDCSLQHGNMKSESLVIANHHVAVNVT